jgi:hypothetical protein
MTIKIFSNLNHIQNERTCNLNPIIELMLSPNSEIKKYFEFTDQASCAYFVIPKSLDLVGKTELNYYLELAKTYKKNIISFSSGDVGKSVFYPSFIQIRLGGYLSKMSSNTFIMSPFIEDPYTIINKEFQTIDKPNLPTIGFVGHSNGSFVKLLKEFILFLRHNFYCFTGKYNLDYEKFFPSSNKRFQFLNILSKSASLKTDFIMRKKYRAGVQTEKDKQTTTLEFYHNIYNNLYTFCMRGGGNFSVRLYETLAMGRIPILLNTDCKLPFDTEIEWAKHCIIINNLDQKSIIDTIVTFHKNHDSTALENIQRSNRKLWETYFTKENFFIQFSKKI